MKQFFQNELTQKMLWLIGTWSILLLFFFFMRDERSLLAIPVVLVIIWMVWTIKINKVLNDPRNKALIKERRRKATKPPTA